MVAVVAVSVGVVTSNNKATAAVNNNNDVSSVNSAALAVDDEDNDEANNHMFTTSDHRPSYSRSQKTPTPACDTSGAASFVRTYSDPNHPGGTREIILIDG